MVGERVQALGPGLVGDDPVAEPGGVVAAVAEPAVVEDVALDADAGGLVGEGEQGGQRVVEVDGLPDVEGDRPLGAGGCFYI